MAIVNPAGIANMEKSHDYYTETRVGGLHLQSCAGALVLEATMPLTADSSGAGYKGARLHGMSKDI